MERFVINGFYMSMREKFTKPDAKIHYYTVEWDGDTLSWADFRSKVLGATDADKAAQGSIRRTILEQWQDLGLPARPNVGDNGVHASASPFEGLTERLNWLGASLESDPFGAQLIERIPKTTILAWTKDPQVDVGNNKASLFDTLEDTNSRDCLQKAQRIAGVAETKDAPNTNTAFVFIKPHAAHSKKVAAVVEAAFKSHGIRILNEGEFDGPTIEAKQYIDNHYYAIADKAALTKPKDLNPPAKAQEEFKAKFGVSWQDVVAQNLIFNAVDACKEMGLSGSQMEQYWGQTKKTDQLVKCGGGFYAGKVIKPAEALSEAFVINGFYMSMREKYTRSDAKIHYYVVEWDGDKLSWADFRGKILGATDPEKAVSGSVRRLILEQWQELGLTHTPSIGDNGVHASASPFEALAERMNWLGAALETDIFGAELLKNIPKETILTWAKDPQVDVDNSKASLFDTLEDTNSRDCLQKAQRIAGVAETKDAPNTNTAFVFIKPHAAHSEKVAALVKATFLAADLTIKTEGEIDGPTIETKQYIDNHYYAIASKAALTKPKDLNPSAKAMEEFKTKFGVSWQDALAQGTVFNALDACQALSLSSAQMDRYWDGAKKLDQLVKFGGGFYAGKVVKPAC